MVGVLKLASAISKDEPVALNISLRMCEFTEFSDIILSDDTNRFLFCGSPTLFILSQGTLNVDMILSYTS
jgi:hypothetical protein